MTKKNPIFKSLDAYLEAIGVDMKEVNQELRFCVFAPVILSILILILIA